MHNRGRSVDSQGAKLGGSHTRRAFLRTTAVAGIGGLLAVGLSTGKLGSAAFPGIAFAAEEPSGVSPDDALKMLMEGNARYVAAKATHPNQTVERRTTVAVSQHPIAAILGCSDSRV